jgi:hypothetical protein
MLIWIYHPSFTLHRLYILRLSPRVKAIEPYQGTSIPESPYLKPESDVDKY